MYTEPRFLPCGDSAISVEFGNEIDASINARVLSLDREIAEQCIEGIVETVPTYRSLLIHYDPFVTDAAILVDRLFHLAMRVPPQFGTNRRWRVPVVYGGDCGVDLCDLCAARGMTERDFIERHAARDYAVCMVGFMPGFAYLGGLDPRLETPRRKSPRPAAPPGTISIGGIQTAVQSVAGPSGWHWIGRTPLRVYDPARKPMCLFEPGDSVHFVPVGPAAWREEEKRCDHMIREAA